MREVKKEERKGKGKGKEFNWEKWTELLETGSAKERKEFLKQHLEKPTLRYYFWEAGPTYGPRQLGRCEGYETIEELKEDMKYTIQQVKEGRCLGWIMKAEIVEEIGEKSLPNIDDEFGDWLHKVKPKIATKTLSRVCTLCGELIVKGQKYMYYSSCGTYKHVNCIEKKLKELERKNAI
ncbi:MAG: hypothetical protein DRP74_00455 [Candidatus Omnitrophota bacterium]|nr:MAG: hypothetical protein DRP74_00455 [Candidatus Omnitrophota bacterium]